MLSESDAILRKVICCFMIGQIANLIVWPGRFTVTKKARALEALGAVEWLGVRDFSVRSESNQGTYHVFVASTLSDCSCTCKDYLLRGRACKHIGACLLSIRGAQKEVAQARALARTSETREASGSRSSEELVPDVRVFQVPRAVLRARSLSLPTSSTAPQPKEQPKPTPSCWEGLRSKAKFLQETARAEGLAGREKSRNREPSSSARGSSEGKEEDTEWALDEAIREIQQEMKALRLDLQKPATTVNVVSSPEPRPELSVGFFFSAEHVHNATVLKVKETKPGGDVVLLAYSFDRRDVADELVRAHKRGCNVRLLVDARQTLQGPREQFAVVQELISQGLNVKAISGRALGPEYKEAGRGGNFGGLVGIQHSKLVYVKTSPEKTENAEYWVCLGSANWTTSSRCNHEISVGLLMTERNEELLGLVSHVRTLWESASSVTDEDVRTAQRARSQSPRR